MGVFILFIQNIIIFLFLTPLIIIGLFQITSTLTIFQKYNKLIVLLEIVYLMGAFFLGALEILCQSGSISNTQGLNDGISDRHRGNITAHT
ncbi:hypothetical protein [Sulfurospirillum barnesii]|uniref:Uncharacterized protein n=1 Tax=Sulfurospirillum barnesii (strain ATCC 700032 / DSM 10660 / SES-3) TaxID=760154 RepID=I3XXI7_SULBS|nr:hypothetical protein [Sulfurospirillum barnesii]AFL68661.1 hypothetical protein Sulba_1372 [Sulfurospirillum barnesii SES-3]